MSDHDHTFTRHPNTDLIWCEHCKTTLDDAIDDLLAEHREILDPSTPGTATEKNRAAMRKLGRALELQREYE